MLPSCVVHIPDTCPSRLVTILREHLDVFVVAYLDDILVYSRTLEEYQLYISKVLEYLGVRDLRLKPEKYKFYIKEINFLEFIIGRNGIRIDLVKL